MGGSSRLVISGHPSCQPRAAVRARARPWRRAWALAGPGTLVAVGYIDPGNWATDLGGGSRYGYSLLSVVVASSLVATLFQIMSARLGIATGLDLAAATRRAYPVAAGPMWVAAELAVIATDVAEVIGSALALKLLFGVPLLAGVVLTALDVTVLLALSGRGRQRLERLVFGLMLVVAVGLAYELALSRPALGPLCRGLLPTTRLLRDPSMLYAAVGILGATVMPHNLYLHSSLVQSRPSSSPPTLGKRRMAREAAIDTIVSLGAAMILNAALVVLAAAAFRGAAYRDLSDLADAHRLLAPLLGSTLAPVVFAVALLAAGQSASITGTLAGQIIMSGFLRLDGPAWVRRLVTRGFALVPAILTIAVFGESSVGRLLVGSQVVLSLQLPFAIVPLILLTSDARRMGALRSSAGVRVAAWSAAAAVLLANGALIVFAIVK